jgi:NADH dehydrogenase
VLRRHILLAFEKAEIEPEARERERLLSFVVIGGGPTGVEMAGAIAELSRKALSADFRSIDARATRVVLIESGPRLLASFHPDLSDAARRSLQMLGVHVRLGKPVTRCDECGVEVDGARIDARTLMLAAGVMASPAAQWLSVEADHAGKVKVNPDLSVPGHPDIFVLGDTASVVGPAAGRRSGRETAGRLRRVAAVKALCTFDHSSHTVSRKAFWRLRRIRRRARRGVDKNVDKISGR